MDFEYDRKFDEMKKYIPFLEGMIKRLESTCITSANPRQAQLDKIRSLRDLLLDKKKRMKMENLLKCEQVLINLYAKVEQRDSLSGQKKTSESILNRRSNLTTESSIKDTTELNIVRNKLKIVASITEEKNVDTLPEIARASETEVVCTVGSKEPALFQRRPNISSNSPSEHVSNKTEKSPKSTTVKRNYTRVLVSPEPSTRHWSLSENHSEKKLFTRRSPRISSSPYNKKERKKIYKRESQTHSDLNITLKVPEESLNSLNTKDILSRIINCSDNDVDIKTLRELRTQILGELKQTGAKEDIADLVLKSYKTKRKTIKDSDEIEEGELSDSESEAIENIYGSLIITENDQNKSVSSNQMRAVQEEGKQSRKIQICLVINSDKDESDKTKKLGNENVIDLSSSNLEMYESIENSSKSIVETSDEMLINKKKEQSLETLNNNSNIEPNPKSCEKKSHEDHYLEETVNLKDHTKSCNSVLPSDNILPSNNQIQSKSNSNIEQCKDIAISKSTDKNEAIEVVAFKANFYKPIVDQDKPHLNALSNSEDENQTCNSNKTIQKEHLNCDSGKVEGKEDTTEIPLLNEPLVMQTKSDVVSEIDILQALKNEILSDNITTHGTESITPPLHQPKIIKVASAQEITAKKRISIETYKEKSASSSKTPLFLKDRKDDSSKKVQSIKLTDKECERFNLADISLDYSSDEENKSKCDDVYKNLAPKSPDNESLPECTITAPVIIPVDPVKSSAICSKTDIDMRKSTLSPVVPATNASLSVSFNDKSSAHSIEIKCDQNKTVNDLPRLVDPRVRRDLNQCILSGSPNQHINQDAPIICPTPVINYSSLPIGSNASPNINTNLHSGSGSNVSASMTLTTHIAPNIAINIGPNLTPSRVHGMTPSHVSFDIDEHNTSQNHVYAPIAAAINDTCNYREPSLNRECGSVQRHDESYQHRYKNDKYQFDKRDDHRSLSLYHDSEPCFQRLECPPTPRSLLETPMTPIHPFGGSEYITMSSPTFVRNECPSTPSYSFGRQECPPTPNHPFGRSDNRSRFNISEPLWEPRTEGYTQNQSSSSFRKTNDPRLNKRIDEKYRGDVRDVELERSMTYRGNLYNSELHNRTYNKSESHRNYSREQSVGRSDMRHTQSTRRNLYRDYEDDMVYSREKVNYKNRSYKEVGSRRNYHREQSVGRTPVLEQKTSYSERHTSRAPTNSGAKAHERSLSIQSHAGRSFTIDTSVSRTFTLDNNFDIRRKRASSVGRSLTSELSTGIQNFSSDNLKKNSFIRARSVGRDSAEYKTDKTLKDIKADFEKFKNKLNFEKQSGYKETQGNENCKTTKIRNEQDNFVSKKTNYEKYHYKKPQGNTTKAYLPRKNIRDPRFHHDERKKELKDDRRHGPSRSAHKYGIVYSNDNIAKGNILGSGYGVKNYKIPKIKRTVEENVESKTDTGNNTKSYEKELKISKTKISLSEEQNLLSSGSPGQTQVTLNNEIDNNKKDITEVENKSDISEKRLTRSSKNVDITEINNKSKKVKNLVYSDSDSSDCTDKNIESGVASRNEFKSYENEKDQKMILKDVSKTEKNILEEQLQSIDTKLEMVEVEIEIEASDHKITGSNKNVDIAELKNESKEGEKPICSESNSDNYTDRNKHLSKDSLNKSSVIESSDKNETDFKPLDNKYIKVDDDSVGSSFGADEMFADNNIVDPVVDNINALIEDLDNDIDANKNTEENECGSVDSKENKTSNPIKEFTCSNNIQDNTGNQYNNDSETLNEKAKECLHNKNINESGETNLEQPKDSKVCMEIELLSPKGDIHLHTNNDFTVSTTEIDNSDLKSLESNEIKQYANNSHDLNSTPDSTIDIEKSINEQPIEEKGLADSTNEIVAEASAVSTATNEITDALTKISGESSTSQCEGLRQIDSIGSLLSILQDKTKIKDLLSMLGENSTENEKIKKKLEKLSEIISDDEDVINEKKGNDSVAKEIIKSSNGNDEEALLQETKEISDENVIFTKNTESICEPKNTSSEFSEKIVKEMQPNEVVLKENALEKEDVANEQPKETTDALKVESSKSVKIVAKKTRVTKKYKVKIQKRNVHTEDKRVTRSESANFKLDKPPTIKKPSRELQLLQNDIKEMFINDDILNSTGIRMCRLAKLVNDKNIRSKDDTQSNDTEPIVLLEKFKTTEKLQGPNIAENSVKKTKQKPKAKIDTSECVEKVERKMPLLKYKPGPKSKTKCIQKQEDKDPYAFEDSVSESNTNKTTENSSDSECDSITSTKSGESSELLTDSKKKIKRKRGRGWQSGIIKPKKKKKKVELDSNNKKGIESNVSNIDKILKQNISTMNNITASETGQIIPDLNCFTDPMYCFKKNVSCYSCRLCEYSGNDIVYHYKHNHPHTEIPLSRMTPEIAKEAIEQCEIINFQSISNISTEKYICRFCLKEWGGKKADLEAFFWHVVSMHTGEYKSLCSECINMTRCPFDLDIPPPPKNTKGQLIGYACGKCNYTQISLENLKTHVMIRHNDEQTEVYMINLSVMSKKAIQSLTNYGSVQDHPRLLRSLRSNQSTSDNNSDITESSDLDEAESESHLKRLRNENKIPIDEITKRENVQSKLTFETDDNISDILNSSNTENMEHVIKSEIEDDGNNLEESNSDNAFYETNFENSFNESNTCIEGTSRDVSDDIVVYPHFKVNYTESGSKSYVCCINGRDNHYKSTLLISLKKHVQMKHTETWDGYCFICKVIVTSQGIHYFKECLQHYVDSHMDNFPVINNDTHDGVMGEKIKDSFNTEPRTIIENPPSPKKYISVRPLEKLMATKSHDPISNDNVLAMPKIANVVSLDPTTRNVYMPETKQSPANNNSVNDNSRPCTESIADIMSEKHRAVLETMLIPSKLVQIFKCAGRFCSFTTDSLEDSLLHSSTHQRVGGVNALRCTYCNFDCSGNGIDLVMHVFKTHSRCPYVCSQCFYRAASSQVVGVHISQIHKQAEMKVLRSSAVTPTVIEESKDLLTRDAAVAHYVCAHVTSDSKRCKFKTFTAGKFSEHLMTRHSSSVSHPCYKCSKIAIDSNGLIQHYGTDHGLKLYQCTWCIHGADTEAEMLEHAANSHPHKQPQAYLRVITVKEGSSVLRVLPLAHLNKSDVPVEEVTINMNPENPVREAERSMELEKLISETLLFIESTTLEPSDIMIPNDIIHANNENVKNYVSEGIQMKTSKQETVMESDMQTEQSHDVSTSQQRLSSSPICLQNTSSTITSLATSKLTSNSPHRLPAPSQIPVTPPSIISVYKTESLEENSARKNSSNSDIVYCLDSDEDNCRQGVIDLSDEINSAPNNTDLNKMDLTQYTTKVGINELFKCSKCSSISKTVPLFKKHILSCFRNNTDVINCAHCHYKTSQKDKLVAHYTSNHSQLKRYICGLCSHRDVYLADLKRHVKNKHNISKFLVNSKFGEGGYVEYTVQSEQTKSMKPSKRKLSGASSSSNTVTMAKQKRYSPQDVNLLPINPILEESVYCSLCEFNTKVRLNMVRHLQLHAEKQPVPETVPVNPVPHLETNEKHFDKMVNLASSSIVTSAPGKSARMETTPIVCLQIPPEAASRYPKYVPERQRHTCGAIGCSYISVDEAMLRCHWETLHSGTNNFHCVHCPPYQHLDTTKPLTAARVLAHLRMHDVRLYACSNCSFYHYKREVLEKHLIDVHKDKGGQVMVVREESTNTMSPVITSVQTISSTAPTMDLKPWQCGLCKFKSMLRPEVVEHCAKLHQSKMQFKCAYCPFRTSTLENVTKHQASSHPTKMAEIFYFYYREGSVPNEIDGTPCWMKQQQKMGIGDIKIKIQPDDELPQTNMSSTFTPKILTVPTPVTVDLNLVKNEMIETESNYIETGESFENLCLKFGQFCDPNGLKYKCPLCKLFVEDSKEVMQSHLFEELHYRKWGCTMCSYKAFHEAGLNNHMKTEHGRLANSKELPINNKIEMWVTKLLEHQDIEIKKNKENLLNQKILTPASKTEPSTVEHQQEAVKSVNKINKYSIEELELAFGKLCAPENMHFCCPKCNMKHKEESIMQEHLELELTKIRWCCSHCPDHFQTYHEAQFHCKSVHVGQSARPKEVIRDPDMRSAWVSAVIREQKLSMNEMPVTESISLTTDTKALENESSVSSDGENSLLVVRYEEKVDLLEQSHPKRKKQMSSQDDSDEDRLVIDEPFDVNRGAKKKIIGQVGKKCPYCNFTSKYPLSMHDHILRHYKLKPFGCGYCDFTSYRQSVMDHIVKKHPGKKPILNRLSIPTEPPTLLSLDSQYESKKKTVQTNRENDSAKVVCLFCEKLLTESEEKSHVHENITPQFGNKGDLVVTCCICLSLLVDECALNEHHKLCHSDIENVNYAYYKLCYDKREFHYCLHCNTRFTFLRELRSHHNAVHNSLPLKYTSKPFNPETNEYLTESGAQVEEMKIEENTIPSSNKMIAKKSTTKLPFKMEVARKSTTKLPFQNPYSYYGSKPTPITEFSKVTTLMPFYNTVLPVTMEKLSEIISINPIVVVKDIKLHNE